MIKLTSRRAALVLAGSAIALVGGMLPAQAATTGWRSVVRVSVKGEETLLTGVDAVAKGDAWAVGGAVTTKDTKSVGIIEHWTGKSWKRITLPASVAKKWNADSGPATFPVLGASSASNVWAFGQNLASSSASDDYLRLNGRKWTVGTLPGTSLASGKLVVVTATRVISSKDVWVFGGISTSNGSSAPYSARFDGSKWLPVPVTPANGDYAIYAAAAATPRSIWAIAEPEAEILHWTPARGWRVAPVQPVLPAGTWLDSVAVEPDGTVWLGGVGGSPGDVITYVGELTRGSTAWRTVKLPSSVSSGGAVPSMTGDGHGGVWALVANGLLLHLTGSSVSVVRPDFGKRPWLLNQLALVPGTGSLWGVGQVGRGSSHEGLIALDGPTPR